MKHRITSETHGNLSPKLQVLSCQKLLNLCYQDLRILHQLVQPFIIEIIALMYIS